MKDKFYSLCVTYPAKFYNWDRARDKELTSLAKKNKGEESGFGMGFGVRHIGFDFPTLSLAFCFYNICCQKKLIHKKYYLTRYQLKWTNCLVDWKDKEIKNE